MENAMSKSEEFLAHHGVKGMKWGIRKAPEPSFGMNRIQKRVEKYRKREQKYLSKASYYEKMARVSMHRFDMDDAKTFWRSVKYYRAKAHKISKKTEKWLAENSLSI